MNRFQRLFGALILLQMAHSCEEYAGRLYDSFPPARFVSGLVSHDLRTGFLVLNVALCLVGAWCFLFPIRLRWAPAGAIAMAWIIIELINGTGHTLWSLYQGGYTPGVGTAPLLFITAVMLLRELKARKKTP